MYIVKKLGISTKGVSFSKKTANWILNRENGTYENVVKTINKVEKFHKLFGKNVKLK